MSAPQAELSFMPARGVNFSPLATPASEAVRDLAVESVSNAVGNAGGVDTAASHNSNLMSGSSRAGRRLRSHIPAAPYGQNSQNESSYRQGSLYTQSATALATFPRSAPLAPRGTSALSTAASGAWATSLVGDAGTQTVDEDFARGQQARAERRRAREERRAGTSWVFALASGVSALAQEMGDKIAGLAGDSARADSRAEARTRRGGRAEREAAHKMSRGRKILLVFVGLVLFLALMFEPVKALYSARRNAELYQTQLSVLAEHNDEYQDKVEYLESRAGIEDLARKRGYVYEGETAVSVDGVASDETAEANALASSNTLEGITTNDPWYIKLLDKLFNYTPSNLVG